MSPGLRQTEQSWQGSKLKRIIVQLKQIQRSYSTVYTHYTLVTVLHVTYNYML